MIAAARIVTRRSEQLLSDLERREMLQARSALTERPRTCLDLDVLHRLHTQSEHVSALCIAGRCLADILSLLNNANLSEGVDALEGVHEAFGHDVPKSKKPNKLSRKRETGRGGVEGSLSSLAGVADGGEGVSCCEGRCGGARVAVRGTSRSALGWHMNAAQTGDSPRADVSGLPRDRASRVRSSFARVSHHPTILQKLAVHIVPTPCSTLATYETHTRQRSSIAR